PHVSVALACAPPLRPGDARPRWGRAPASGGRLELLDEGFGRTHAVGRVGPADDLKNPLLGLAHGRAAFDPGAGVDVDDVADLAHGGVMDVAADHALRAVAPRFLRQRRLELADIVHRALHLVFPIGPTPT